MLSSIVIGINFHPEGGKFCTKKIESNVREKYQFTNKSIKILNFHKQIYQS